MLSPSVEDFLATVPV